jgi:predicted permease
MTIDASHDECRWVWRNLCRTPVSAAAVILSLAIGIGTTTAAFSGLNALTFKPLPVPSADRLYQVVLGNEAASHVPSAVFDTLRGHPDALGRLAAANAGRYRLRVGDVSQPSEVLFASGELFDVLDVSVLVGRSLTRDDDRATAPLVGVLSYHAWHERFGGAVDAVGATVFVQGMPVTVVGIAPASFHGVHVGRRFDIALPLSHVQPLQGLQPGALWTVSIIGRRRDDTTLEMLSARLRTLQSRVREETLPPGWRAESRDRYLREPLRATSAETGVATRHSDQATSFFVLMTAALIVLVIACVNVAHWLMARQRARKREFAVRAAMGASRAHLRRLVWLESLVLAGLGAVGGVGLATLVGARLVDALASSVGAMALDLRPDWRVNAGCAGLVALAAFIGGMSSARRLSPADLHAQLTMSQGNVRGMSHGTRVLAAVQVATLIALICGTTLLARSYVAVVQTDPGFDADGLWVADTLLGDDASTPTSKVDAYARVAAAVAALPGVAAVGGASVSPIAGNALVTLVEVEGTQHPVYLNRVTSGYFDALHLPLLAGPDVSESDRGGTRVAVVNEAFARLVFGARSPLGASVTRVTLSTNARVPLQIVGVVADSAYLSTRESEPATIYVPLVQEPAPDAAISLALRWQQSQAPPLDALLRAAALSGPGADVTVTPLSTSLAKSWAADRALAMVAGALSLMALATSVLGLYGVLSRMVLDRSRELGVRAALGATRGAVVRIVLMDAGIVALLGGVLGAAATTALAPALTAVLFGVAPLDGMTVATGIGVLVLTVGCAAALPARRAALVDPAAVLRSD